MMKNRVLFSPFLGALCIFLGASVLACSTAQKQEGEAERTPVSVSSSKNLLSDVVASLSVREATDGSVIQLRIQGRNLGNEAVSAEFNGEEIPLFQDTDCMDCGMYQGLVGIPFAYMAGPASVVVRIGNGPEARSFSLPFTVRPGNYRTIVLRVNPRNVHPSSKDLIRIQRDVEEVGAIYQTITRQKLWNSPFFRPVTGAINSVYGTRRVFNGEMQSYHQGVDMRAPRGTPIHAAASGRVALAKNLFFSGNTILVDHGYGIYTLYCHMSRLKVRKGQQVKVGAVLGLSGMTGRANGPHLHWATIIHGVKVNPVEFLKVMGPPAPVTGPMPASTR